MESKREIPAIELSNQDALREVANFASEKLLALGAQEAIVIYRLGDELLGRLKCTRDTQARAAVKLLMDSGMPMIKVTPEEVKEMFGFEPLDDDSKGEG